MPYRRELLFNQQKLPDHPVATLSFTNETGLVLERGPVTVVEDGEYRGEALVPFTTRGSEVSLAFAVELGITVKRTVQSRVETVGLRLEKALLWTRQAYTSETTYELTSDLATDDVVTVEHPLYTEAELVDTPEPDATTPNWRRWRVPCPAHQTSIFVVAERREDWRQQALLDVSYDALREYLERRWLDEATLQRIRALLEQRRQIGLGEVEQRELETDRDAIYRREEELRKNLTALATTGEEAALRQRVLEQLRAAEDRLTAIDASLAAIKEENKRRQAALEVGLTDFRAVTPSGQSPQP